MKRSLIGFIISILVLFSFLYIVGINKILALLSSAKLSLVFLGIISAVLALTFWSVVWGKVLNLSGVYISGIKLFLSFLGATFMNFITPFGQVGGEPFIALVVSKNSGSSYERSLAGVIAADIVNLVPFFTLAGFGSIYIAFNGSLDPIKSYILALVAVFILLSIMIVSLWHFKKELAKVVLILTSPIFEKEKVSKKLNRFFETLGFIWEAKSDLKGVVIISHIGWIFTILPLYISSWALGYEVPFVITLLVVPLAGISGYLPLPGGLGGVEVTTALLLSTLTPISLTAASAVALLYRICVYWFVLLIGGLSFSYISRNMKI